MTAKTTSTPKIGLKLKPISRRDYFATAAMQALIEATPPAQHSIDGVAEKAYCYADAMIQAGKADETD